MPILILYFEDIEDGIDMLFYFLFVIGLYKYMAQGLLKETRESHGIAFMVILVETIDKG